ncbi:MAG: hypothetical protein Kow0040_28300 [Thermogutta sp.]
MILNGAKLRPDKEKSDTSPHGLTNRAMCWPVERMLAAVNRLLVRFPGDTLQSAEPTLGSEDDRPPQPSPGVVECFLEIDEDAG